MRDQRAGSRECDFGFRVGAGLAKAQDFGGHDKIVALRGRRKCVCWYVVPRVARSPVAIASAATVSIAAMIAWPQTAPAENLSASASGRRAVTR